MLASLASLSDLAELIEGGIPVGDQLRAGRNLLHASVTVRHGAGWPAGWAEDDADPDFPVALDVPDALVMVTLEVAKRAFENPNGYSSQTMGDYAYTVEGGGNTYLTRAEQDMLASYAPVAAAQRVQNYTLDDRYRAALRGGYC